MKGNAVVTEKRFRAIQVFELEFSIDDRDLEEGDTWDRAATEIAGSLPVTDWDSANFYLEEM